MEHKLKQLIKHQIINTEIPSYFEWCGRRIFYNNGSWIVYNAYGRLYGGVDFDTALEMLLDDIG